MHQIALAGALVAATLIWKPWLWEMKRDEEKERNCEESMGILRATKQCQWNFKPNRRFIFLELSKIGLPRAI